MNKNVYVPSTLSSNEKAELLTILQERFRRNMDRHQNTNWEDVLTQLESNEQAIISLQAMEMTRGEPDVVEMDSNSKAIVFFDCSKQSPAGRRKVCYDDRALKSRKKYPPETSARDLAEKMGIELLNETQYRSLQTFGEFDTKTSSWIQTPEDIRDLGGALYCDRRYDTVFVYHNGADSYYASRGFRGYLSL